MLDYISISSPVKWREKMRDRQFCALSWVYLDIDMIFVDVVIFHFFKTDGYSIKRLRFLGDWNEWWYILGGNDGL